MLVIEIDNATHIDDSIAANDKISKRNYKSIIES